MAELLLYSYYFKGIKKPVIVQAANKMLARDELVKALPTLDAYKHKTTEDIVAETVCHPVTDVSTVEREGKKYLFVGYDKSHDGWKEISET